MRADVPLTDEDRHAWLTTLASKLSRMPGHTVLVCSALKRAYRDILQGAEGACQHVMGFVYMALTEAESYARVAQCLAHGFPASLMHSQFEALESLEGERGVLRMAGAARAIAPLARAWPHPWALKRARLQGVA